MEEKETWTHIPVTEATKIRLADMKNPKPNRKKWEHYLETVDNVINRLIDFWKEQHEVN